MGKFIVYAHYRKDVKPCEYPVKTLGNQTKKDVKAWFEKTYSWLTVFDVVEAVEG
jgi:hypothetical protein